VASQPLAYDRAFCVERGENSLTQWYWPQVTSVFSDEDADSIDLPPAVGAIEACDLSVRGTHENNHGDLTISLKLSTTNVCPT